MRVEVEARAVVANGVPADGGRGVFELLRDVFDHPLAVHAQEGAAHLRPQRRAEQSSDKFDVYYIFCVGVAAIDCFHACADCRISYQFRVDRVRPHHLTADPHQAADAHG